MLGIDYRPKNFSEVIGQKTVVKAVTNYIKNNNYPQSSIFLGASGNGKSTISRLVAKTLNCKNPIADENGIIQPCCNCANCRDIENERFQFGTKIYNGTDLTIDKIREIDESLSYEPIGSKNNIIIIEEAQTVPSVAFRSLLTLTEKKRNNTYFILTSTDKDKFSGSSWANDNKSQEKVAIKSRLVNFNIKPTQTSEIEEYLFSILCKLDPNEELPPTVEELISYIAMNSHGNIRDAMNSFDTCISANIYTKEECMDLFGGEDVVKEYDVVNMLAYKSKDALKYIENSSDIHGNFVYWNKIISDVALHSMIGIPYQEQWKEESSKKIILSGNIKALLECFAKTSSENGAYWNDSVFVKNLYVYYNSENNNVTECNKVKKVMKVKKEV